MIVLKFVFHHVDKSSDDIQLVVTEAGGQEVTFCSRQTHIFKQLLFYSSSTPLPRQEDGVSVTLRQNESFDKFGDLSN